ncbi:hypothetical protein [Neoroseomonas lacus]|uniref:Uncharacterized protein n=1 Tax=Neoroseomonas lacus TaxID=287609 RepID=A0A917KI01_9PROT|nr:hypothetical protein [Neoroseomonas lacus]GGJ14423.1 hypothetical protein GCM10011320_22050 [Neoroseomonas lacus]
MPDGVDTAHESPVGPPRGRRLIDKLIVPFHSACDQGDLEVAERLLRVVELMLLRRPPAGSPDMDRRKNQDIFVAAHERLWELRHRVAERV